MKYLSELQKKKVFGLDYAEKLTGNRLTAKSMLQSYKKAGCITGIRRNIYAALDLASSDVIANRYEIACAVCPGAFISHHSALEFHGVANQVFQRVTVSAPERFQSFSFQGITYEHHKADMRTGVINPGNNPFVYVTDAERTVVDCIDDIGLAGGLEELMNALLLLPELREEKLLSYLQVYDRIFLWQKTGFFLKKLNDRFNLSEEFFAECRRHIHQRKQYLVEEEAMVYSSDWKLYVPEYLPGIRSAEGELV